MRPMTVGELLAHLPRHQADALLADWKKYERANERAREFYDTEDPTIDQRYHVDTSPMRHGPAEREIARDRDRSDVEAWEAYLQKNERARQHYDSLH